MKKARALVLSALLFSFSLAAEMAKNAKIYVAGHSGLVGSAIVRALKEEGYTNIITRTHEELDLRNQQEVYRFFDRVRPEYVFLAAAKVGGILANQRHPAAFLYDNLMIEANIIHASYHHRVKKLLFLGSSCIYPRLCPQPIKEEYLLSGDLEQTNYGYAVAKIAGIMLCRAYNEQYGTRFIACMPTNLYGPYDNFDLESSHVLPALLRKFYEAAERGDTTVTVWGSGEPYREFLYVEDLADACIFLMQQYDGKDIINIGTGIDITIADLADMIQEIVGFQGEIVWDRTKPDGTPRKLLAVDRIKALGWTAKTDLKAGLQKTFDWCRRHHIFD